MAAEKDWKRLRRSPAENRASNRQRKLSRGEYHPKNNEFGGS